MLIGHLYALDMPATCNGHFNGGITRHACMLSQAVDIEVRSVMGNLLVSLHTAILYCLNALLNIELIPLTLNQAP